MAVSLSRQLSPCTRPLRRPTLLLGKLMLCWPLTEHWACTVSVGASTMRLGVLSPVQRLLISNSAGPGASSTLVMRTAVVGSKGRLLLRLICAVLGAAKR